MTGSKEGRVAELRVAAKMMDFGYEVSDPLSDTKYDLVAEKNGEFTRVQVKHGRMKNGCVRATLCGYDGSSTHVYTGDEIDMFAVHNEDHGCFFIPFEDAPEQLIHIRVEDPEIENPTIRHAEDYRANERL